MYCIADDFGFADITLSCRFLDDGQVVGIGVDHSAHMGHVSSVMYVDDFLPTRLFVWNPAVGGATRAYVVGGKTRTDMAARHAQSWRQNTLRVCQKRMLTSSFFSWKTIGAK